MSLILDALRRAERERSRGHAPGVAAVTQVGAVLDQRLVWPWVALGLLLICALTTLGVYLLRPEPQPVPQASPVTAATTLPAQPTPPPIAQAAPPQPPAVIPGTEEIRTLDEVAAEPEPVEETPSAATKPAQPVQKTPAPTSTNSKTAADTSVPAQQPVAPDPPAPEPAGPKRLKDMPPAYRADFPALNVEVHSYSTRPEKRFVLINGHRYGDGERLAEGPQIVTIVPEGIVFDYRGERVLVTLSR